MVNNNCDKHTTYCFYAIVFGEFCERLSYYGNLTILVLYLSKIYKFNDATVYLLYGAYAACSFALPLIGGALGDKLIGNHKAIILGSVFIILGNIILTYQNYLIFCIGLSVVICGTGLYKSNSAALVGKLYLPNENRRETGFTLFYIGMNLGATLGGIFYGIALEKLHLQYGFLLSAILMLISLTFYKEFSALIFKIQDTSLVSILICFVTLSSLVSILSFAFYLPSLLNTIFYIFSSLLLISISLILVTQNQFTRKRIFCLFLFCFFSMCFFAVSFQVSSSVALFINRHINRQILSWTIPTAVFSSLYPLSVIVVAPLITFVWSTLKSKQYKIPSTYKVLFGLIFGILGFSCFTLATLPIYHTTSYLPLLEIVLGNMCLGAGELCLVPIVFSVIMRLSPEKLHGTLLGIWFLSVACAGYVGGFIEKASKYLFYSRTATIQINSGMYTQLFLTNLIIIAVVATLLFFTRNWLEKTLKIGNSP